MASPRTLSCLVTAVVLATGACQRHQPPPTPPPAPESTGVSLRYQAPATPVRQQIELQLTHTRLGLYVEAGLEAQAELTLTADGSTLRTAWDILELTTLELDGTVEPGDVERVQALLTEQGKGILVADETGLLDLATTDAEPANTARDDALAADGDAAPPTAGVLLMAVLAQQLRLPRLPVDVLEPGELVEIEEETETVVTDADLVLPTTTVHRFTLHKIETIDGARIAEIEVASASVAEAEPLPEEEPKKGKKKGKKKKGKKKPEPEEPVPVAELHSKTEGTLMFDLDRGLPVSLELTHSETFRVGDQELEQSFQLRSTYSLS